MSEGLQGERSHLITEPLPLDGGSEEHLRQRHCRRRRPLTLELSKRWAAQDNSAGKSNFLLIGPWAAALDDSPSGRKDGIVAGIPAKRARMALASVSSSKRESAAALGTCAAAFKSSDARSNSDLVAWLASFTMRASRDPRALGR
eukprot:1843565-Pyramimonas_sp.AAC.1